MLDAATSAELFIEGISFEQFHRDRKTVFAVIRALEIIGEAARKVPRPSQAELPLLPWQDMAGMRDKLIHDYMGVNESVVWKTVKEDLPVLRVHLVRYLRVLEDADET